MLIPHLITGQGFAEPGSSWRSDDSSAAAAAAAAASEANAANSV